MSSIAQITILAGGHGLEKGDRVYKVWARRLCPEVYTFHVAELVVVKVTAKTITAKGPDVNHSVNKHVFRLHHGHGNDLYPTRTEAVSEARAARHSVLCASRVRAEELTRALAEAETCTVTVDHYSGEVV